SLQGETITVDALVASVDGRSIIRERLAGKATEGREIGRQLAERLLARGGRAILNEIYGRA
ncbi:MAG: hydroxymethylbilane synthase, partial [Nitrospirae bacterium]|nr:hydroxymethylbilane synthase [Nitrospirota bacterium]